MYTSVNHSQQDAVELYENPRALIKHFTYITKSMDILNEICAILEINNVHILNWGSTRMGGFLDVCIQSSYVIVLFIDALVKCKIKPYS